MKNRSVKALSLFLVVVMMAVSMATSVSAAFVLSGQTIVLNKGETYTILNNSNVTWESENEKVATVDEAGIVTAVDYGKTTVIATYVVNEKVMAIREYVVRVSEVFYAESVKVSAERTTVMMGSTLQLKAEVLPAKTTDKSVTWSIKSGSSFATISEDGVLKAIKAGTVTVRATAKDGSGKYGEFTVRVLGRNYLGLLGWRDQICGGNNIYGWYGTYDENGKPYIWYGTPCEVSDYVWYGYYPSNWANNYPYYWYCSNVVALYYIWNGNSWYPNASFMPFFGYKDFAGLPTCVNNIVWLKKLHDKCDECGKCLDCNKCICEEDDEIIVDTPVIGNPPFVGYYPGFGWYPEYNTPPYGGVTLPNNTPSIILPPTSNETESGNIVVISRSQFAYLLGRFAKVDVSSYTVDFSDMSDKVPYAKYAAWAVAEGYLKVTDNKFNPNKILTRIDLIAALYEYAKDCGKDVSVAKDYLKYCVDVNDLTEDEYAALNWAVAKGLYYTYSAFMVPGTAVTDTFVTQMLSMYRLYIG